MEMVSIASTADTGPIAKKSDRKEHQPMRQPFILLAASLLLALPLAAHATPIVDTAFTLSGTYSSNGVVIGSVTGTLEINTVSGVLDSGTITYTADNLSTYLLTLPPNAKEQFGATDYYYEFIDAGANAPLNFLNLAFGTDFVGYTGGSLCDSNAVTCGGRGNDAAYIVVQLPFNRGSLSSGTLVLAPAMVPVSATPEPSSFVLLGTGILGLASVARRKFLKA